VPLNPVLPCDSAKKCPRFFGRFPMKQFGMEKIPFDGDPAAQEQYSNILPLHHPGERT